MAGKQTQKIQDDILKRLDKLIEDKENKQKQKEQNDAEKQEQQNQREQNPLPDSKIENDSGQGIVQNRSIKKLRESWGRLSPMEQARAMQNLVRNLSPRHREGIENYFRNLNKK